jgi:hypothetical protein
VNGKLAHECVVFGTLMPRFSCRGVACAERQSETNFPKNTEVYRGIPSGICFRYMWSRYTEVYRALYRALC